MKTFRNLVAILLALAAGACATATPYQPLRDGEGFIDQRIESNRYRIRFVGNASTPRETVENYLLYRAAELSLQAGYDYFILADQKTHAQTSYYQTFGFSGGFGRYYWGPRLDFGTVTPETAYEGVANVVMFKGQKRDSDVKAFDARQVKANLEPQIARPGDKDATR